MRGHNAGVNFFIKCEGLLWHFLKYEEVRLIVAIKYSYQDLQAMFGDEFEMPPVEALKGDMLEYRCPYIAKCPANANCFAIETPKPLQDGDILNIRCRLCGNKKIPVYARCAEQVNQ